MTHSRRLVAVLASHNRRAVTLAGLGALFAQQASPPVAVEAVLVDDGSTDGTAAAVAAAFPAVRIVEGDGTLWWGGAVARGLAEAGRMPADFHLWLNDDVRLDPDALAQLLACHDTVLAETGRAPIVIGATRDPRTGRPSYGGQRRVGTHPLRLKPVHPDGTAQPCDTFQGNIVLVPAEITRRLAGVGPEFLGVQGMADTDFGLRATAAGIDVRIAGMAVGVCEAEPRTQVWRDRRLGLRARLGALIGPRGYPPRAYLRLMRRHGGPLWWLRTALTYARGAAEAVWPPAAAPRQCRLAVLEGVVPHYRTPVLAGLARWTDVATTVYRGEGVSGLTASSVPLAQVPLPTVSVRNRFWPGGGGRRIWTGGTLAAMTGRADAVLLGLHVHDLAVWAALLVRRMTGRPRLLLSGHFRLDPDPDRSPRRFDGLARRMRAVLARNADAVLPYTPRGAEACRRHGVPIERIHVAHNSVDIVAVRAVAAGVTPDDQAAFRSRLGLPQGPLLLSVARLYPAKRVELAIEAVKRLRAGGRDCGLVIVGDGPERSRLEHLAGDDRGIRFAGAIVDEPTLAAIFTQAVAFVLPGAVGLGVTHAFAYGLPVVTCHGPAHGPEVDYIEPGRNGSIVAADVSSLESELARLLDEPGWADRLSAGARQTADGLTTDAGIAAIRGALGLGPHD